MTINASTFVNEITAQTNAFMNNIENAVSYNEAKANYNAVVGMISALDCFYEAADVDDELLDSIANWIDRMNNDLNDLIVKKAASFNVAIRKAC